MTMIATDQAILARVRHGMSLNRTAQIYGVSTRYVAALYSASKGLPSAFPAPKQEEKQRAMCPVFFDMPLEAQDIVLKVKVQNDTSLDAIFRTHCNIPAAISARKQLFYELAGKLGWSVPTIAIHTQYSEPCVRGAIKDHCRENNLSQPTSCRTRPREVSNAL
ncbi:hypothetical protein [Pseudovibrio sp. Tun.PSC04-5.I4]|uniref:hypothetical protein n=1 Tax=Pseudovibrio sp. Tun.PSC04-5.I4 TaxID=1798213 RepID=UPI000887CC10|nr:hypothetical protein [Pseudovibrio sp. Tun.PSC04-5.I4]SDR34901.1 hypothetical protein SAMN04515695_4792 [Pseudovibrio sp. Tun.PSC04-5.I4]